MAHFFLKKGSVPFQRFDVLRPESLSSSSIENGSSSDSSVRYLEGKINQMASYYYGHCMLVSD